MACYLGIDTSNYTTSVAVYDAAADRVYSEKLLLPVKEGERGLRQSDAVFAHVKQLPAVIKKLFAGRRFDLRAASVSAFPRRQEGSYMPAFLVGEGMASALADALDIPLFRCSHQEGHILSALYSSDAMELLQKEFYAFHVSGGTTECLLVRPERNAFAICLLAKTLDLNAGQLIDRVGVRLGLSFPSGPALDRLSREWVGETKIKPSFKGADCHFSGAENLCEKLLNEGRPPAEVARYAVEYVLAAVDGMTKRVMEQYGEKPVVYAGGVMSNSLIRERLTEKYRGRFAAPEFSSDNAAGPALFAWMQDKE